MWKIGIDYSEDLAKQFLVEDFLKVVKRTKYLYVDTKPTQEIGYGFYEPVLLALCWCDFLGSLYCGNGKMGNTARSKVYIESVLGSINEKYKEVSSFLVKNYRNGAAHAYAPDGSFNIILSDDARHLEETQNPHMVKISISTLLNDLEASVIWFSDNLKPDNDPKVTGSIGAFNQARRDLLEYENEETNN